VLENATRRNGIPSYFLRQKTLFDPQDGKWPRKHMSGRDDLSAPASGFLG